MQSHFPPKDANTTLEAEFQRVICQRQGSRLPATTHPVSRRLKQVGIALVNFLTGAQTLAVRSKPKTDGTIEWIVYDPTTNNRQVFASEEAVRTWLAERYHRES